MSALTSLLFRDHVVPVRKIEEAIQRQVVSGGDLETILLEMDAIPENVASAYRAAIHGLIPATRDEVMKVPMEVIRKMPPDVASRYRLIPLSLNENRLVVATVEPLSAEDVHRLGFLLGCDIVMRIVTEVRMAAALAHHYGLPTEPRFRRLIERLRARDPGSVPYVAPAEPTRSTSSAPGPSVWTVEDDAAEPEGAGTDRLTFQLPQAREELAEGSWSGRSDEGGRPSFVNVAPVVGVGVARAPTPLARRASPSALEEPSSLLAGRLRGPLLPRRAVELIASARNRDEIVHVLFAFARQFFDYTALFVLHEDIAEGREAFGNGADQDAVRRMAVPLDVPGTFSEVRDTATPRIVDLRARELDAIVASDLARTDTQPALLLPIAIRQRVVLIVYGDRSGENFTISDIPELLAFTPRVADAFQRLILERKLPRSGRPPSSSLPPAETPPVDPSTSVAPQVAAHDVVAVPEVEASDVAVPEVATREVATREVPMPEGVAGVAEEAHPSETSSPGEVAPFAGGEAVPSSFHDAPTVRRPQTPPPERMRPEEPTGRRHTVLGLPTTLPPPDAGEGTRTRPRRITPFAKSQPPSRPAEFGALGVPRTAPPPPDVSGAGFYQARPAHVDVAPTSAPAVADEPTHDTSTDPDVEIERVEADAAERPSVPELPSERTRSISVPALDRPNTSDTRREAETPRADEGSVHVARGLASESAVFVEGKPMQLRTLSDPPLAMPSEQPSIIIDMGTHVEDAVQRLMEFGPDDEGAALRVVFESGEAALPVLAQRFPGPLWFDRHLPHRRLPRGRDVSAVARALVAFQDRAIPYVPPLIEARDADVRFYGTLLASELIHPTLVAPLGRRIFDPDPGIQALVLDVLKLFRHFDSDFEQLLRQLRVVARVQGKEPQRRLTAIRALGELRDTKSLGLLIEMLRAADADLVRAAHRSLVVLTRQDFGEASRRWVAWAERNLDRHRVEWLIDSLMHEDEKLRAAAGDELKHITQQYYGFHPGLPKRDREIAQRKYREWWEAEGRKSFG